MHGAYPTYEYNDIIFAYLGPPELKPEFPQFDCAQVSGIEAVPFSITTPCNWLQVYENTQDPIHVLHLHARSSGVQFGVASGVDQEIEYRNTPIGMINVQSRRVGDHLWIRSTESILPNMNQTGAIFEEATEEKYFQRSAILRWMVPISNTETKTIGWRFFSDALDPERKGDRQRVGKEMIDFIGQTAEERPYSERQRQPGDYEAQVSQRKIAVHALENHASSDAGIMRIRHLLRKAVRSLSDTRHTTYSTVGKHGIATYIQDTVTPWPGNKPESVNDENALLREYGSRLTDILIESASQTPAKRKQLIRDVCRNFASQKEN